MCDEIASVGQGAESLLQLEDARHAVLRHSRSQSAEVVPLPDALGRVLAVDQYALGNVPSFASSAMDGYAAYPGSAGRVLAIAGESRAGHPVSGAVASGEAIRISTGAVVPSGLGVVPVERTVASAGFVELRDDVSAGSNVRRPGEDLRAGDLALTAGSVLRASDLALMAACGAADLEVFRRPRVAVVVTGDELAAPGATLSAGRIHDANSLSIAGLARECGAEIVYMDRVPDQRAATQQTLTSALDVADLLLISGGVSVGAHDHVKSVLDSLGVARCFWGVSLQPGKPIWFGTCENKLVLGLPGNPVAAVVSFLLLARPAIRALHGDTESSNASSAVLGESLRLNHRRTQAVRVSLRDDGGVRTAYSTGPQNSHLITSLRAADALALLPPGEGALSVGSVVDIELI